MFLETWRNKYVHNALNIDTILIKVTKKYDSEKKKTPSKTKFYVCLYIWCQKLPANVYNIHNTHYGGFVLVCIPPDIKW